MEGSPRELLWFVLGYRKLMRRNKWDHHSMIVALKPWVCITMQTIAFAPGMAARSPSSLVTITSISGVLSSPKITSPTFVLFNLVLYTTLTCTSYHPLSTYRENETANSGDCDSCFLTSKSLTTLGFSFLSFPPHTVCGKKFLIVVFFLGQRAAHNIA